jgi:hypothetical protein
MSKEEAKEHEKKVAEVNRKGAEQESYRGLNKKSGKDCDASMTPSDGDLIPINDEWSEEARKKAAEARKSGSSPDKEANKKFTEKIRKEGNNEERGESLSTQEQLNRRHKNKESK